MISTKLIVNLTRGESLCLGVLDIVERLRPWRVASKRRARAVLELSAGECARRGVAVGDKLELRERDAKRLERFMGSGPSGAWQRGEVSRLQQLRVLVVSDDSRFRTVMSLLLARRNCSVTTTANAKRVSERADRERSDVIVIDAGRCPVSATLAKVEALPRPVGVVLVADEADSGASEPPMLAKWGPFGSFVEAIEQADRQRGRWARPMTAHTSGCLNRLKSA